MQSPAQKSSICPHSVEGSPHSALGNLCISHSIENVSNLCQVPYLPASGYVCLLVALAVTTVEDTLPYLMESTMCTPMCMWHKQWRGHAVFSPGISHEQALCCGLLPNYLFPTYFRATLHEDTTYASPGKETAATEGADGVYPYAATTTVVGAKMDPRRRAGKEASDETKYAQPDKPKRDKQPPTTADVPHKQEPAGELYAMPVKKPLTVGHAQGPQGDMYAVPAKPSKVSEYCVVCATSGVVSLVITVSNQGQEKPKECQW